MEQDVERLPFAAVGTVQPPVVDLSGPDDVDTILRLREHYTTSMYARSSNKTTVENRGRR